MNLKKIVYEYRPVHLLKEGGQQHRKDFLALNPKGEVPLLVHGDFRLGQSLAILTYLDEAFPDPKIFPEDPWKKAHCLEICELINAGIQPLQNLKVLQRVEAVYHIDKMKWGRFFIEEGMSALEKLLQGRSGTFSLGNEVTAADFFLVPQVYNALRFKVELEQFPRIKKINENCLKLRPFQEASPECQPDAP